MFSRILVPVDFSEHAAHAFGYAALVARACGGRLELVHVIEQVVHSHPSFWSAEPTLADELHRQAIASAERLLGELLASKADELGSASGRVVSGSLPGALADHAAQANSDLIVMSTHGRTGFARWLMGSVTERLLRVAPCPVLVVRGTAPAAPVVRKILVAIDLSDHSRRAFQVAAKLSGVLGAALEVLHVVPVPVHADGGPGGPGLLERMRDSARAELGAFIADCSKSEDFGARTMTQTLATGLPTAAINEHVVAHQPDLLVLGTHGYGGVKRMVLGSVAEAVTRYASCATLVVR